MSVDGFQEQTPPNLASCARAAPVTHPRPAFSAPRDHAKPRPEDRGWTDWPLTIPVSSVL